MSRDQIPTTTINHKDYDLNWNKALEASGVVVGDEVIITLEIEMIKAKEKYRVGEDRLDQVWPGVAGARGVMYESSKGGRLAAFVNM